MEKNFNSNLFNKVDEEKEKLKKEILNLESIKEGKFLDTYQITKALKDQNTEDHPIVFHGKLITALAELAREKKLQTSVIPNLVIGEVVVCSFGIRSQEEK